MEGKEVAACGGTAVEKPTVYSQGFDCVVYPVYVYTSEQDKQHIEEARSKETLT